LPRVGGGDSLLESAIADLERSRTLDPRRFDTWSRLASAYGSAGRHTDALFAYQRALDADVFQRGRRDEDLRGLYDAALNAGLFADAEAACRTGLRQYPRAWIFRDCELRLLSRTARTSRDGARALALADSLMPIEAIPLWRSLDALHASAALARTGRGAEADRLAARAMAPLPDQPLLMLELAWVRLQRGDTTGAIAQLADAIHREPSFRRGAVQRFSGLESDPRFSSAVSGVRP
jgi:tetratricopeptide (TPR) repeat protein